MICITKLITIGDRGVDQFRQPGLPTLLARQAGQQHDVGLRLQPVHGHPDGTGRLPPKDHQVIILIIVFQIHSDVT